MKFLGLCTATVVQGQVHRVSSEHQGTAKKPTPNPKNLSGTKASRTAFVLGRPCNRFIAAVVTFVLKYFKICTVVNAFSSFATSYDK